MCRKLNFPTSRARDGTSRQVLFVLASVLCLAWGSVGQADATLRSSSLRSTRVPKPVGFWRFEVDAADLGSGGNNGILKGSAELVVDEQRGKCLKLDGNGYVDIPSGVTELGAADFTIAVWIKTGEIGVPILSKSNGNGEWEQREKELNIADSEISEGENDGTVEYVGHSVEWVRGSTSVNDGWWHHIAITWDADEEEGHIYVDGVEGADDVSFLGLADNADDTVRIGFSESVHSSGNFVGRLDDVAIFNVTLTAEQVVELRKLTGGDKIKVTKPIPEKDKPVTLDTDPNLAGWWKFDEASGKTAADSSRHGRKGALKGDLSFDKNSVAGKTGKALKLDGGDDYIEITKYKGVTGTRPRTVAAWIKTTSSRGEIISWGTEDYGKMWRYCFIRGRVGVTPHGGYYYINDAVHDDKWHHVAVVVVEAELPNLHDDVRLYKDGTLAEIHDIGLLDLWPLETGNKLDVRIGRRFKGLIDDVRIYDRALSEDEIKALFMLKSSRPLPKSSR